MSEATGGRKARPAASSGLSLWRLGLALFLCLLVIGPIPYGAFRDWIWPFLSLVLALSAVLMVLPGLRGQGRVPSFRPLVLPLILTMVAPLWIVVQGLPAPLSGWQAPLLDITGDVLGVPAGQTVSRTPEAAMPAAILLLTYILAFGLAFWAGRDRANARLILWAVLISAALQSGWGIVNVITGLEHLLWDEKETYLGVVTGTLVNRNHVATLIGFGILAGLALLWRAFRSLNVSIEEEGRLGILLRLFERNLILLGLLTLCLMALPMTLSRGGILATGIAVVTLGLLIGFSKGGAAEVRRRYVIPGAILFSLVATALAGTAFLERVGQTTLTQVNRDEVYAMTLRAIADNPWLGFGAGSYPGVSEQYRPPNLEDPVRWNFAHNTYLEAAAEWGLPATFAYFGAVTLIWLACLRGARFRMRDAELPSVAAAAGVLGGLHALVDFSLQAPAVALLFAALMGMGYAQARSSREE
ncbi:MAG: O-antigen ligase family protein [Rhodospirillaceae bacterium]